MRRNNTRQVLMLVGALSVGIWNPLTIASSQVMVTPVPFTVIEYGPSGGDPSKSGIRANVVIDERRSESEAVSRLSAIAPALSEAIAVSFPEDDINEGARNVATFAKVQDLVDKMNAVSACAAALPGDLVLSDLNRDVCYLVARDGDTLDPLRQELRPGER